MEKTYTFDWWDDLQNKATELLGKATGNPAAVIHAQTAQAVNEALAKSGIDKSVTAQDIAAQATPEQKKVISDSVTESFTGWSKYLKIILIITVIVVLIALFYRVSGK